MADRFLIFRGDKHPWTTEGWFITDVCWTLPEADVSIVVGDSLQLRKGLFSTCAFFYAVGSDLFVASTSWMEVVRTSAEYGIPLGCEPEFVWQYLQSQCPLTNKTFCRNVYVLRSGEAVTCAFGSKPEATLTEHTSLTAEAARGDPDLRALLNSSLLGLPMQHTGFHLSAGLDSSILVILARELSPEAPIKAFSCKTLGKGAGEELPNVERLAHAYGLDLTIRDFTGMDVLLEGKRLMEAIPYPIAHPSHLTRFLLDGAISVEHIDYVVTGRGADECLAGYPWHLPDYADPSRHRERVLICSEELLRSIFTEQCSAVAFSRWSEPTPLSLRERLQYDWWTLFESWNVIEQSFEDFWGFKYINPFLNKKLVAEVIAMPAAKLIAGGTPKSYLKKFFKYTYPEYILEYPKHGLTIDMNAYFRNYLSSQIMDAIFTDSSFARKYLRRREVERLITETLRGSQRYGWQIWSLYLASLASVKLQSTAHQVDDV